MTKFDKHWAYSHSQPIPNNQQTLDLLIDNDDKMLELVIQLTNRYCDLQAQVQQQKRVIAMQGAILNSCMERIMTLEGRSVLGNFNQRLEQLEDNTAKYYSINDKELTKMLENVVRRVDELESYLYTHDYNYFQEEEKSHETM